MLYYYICRTLADSKCEDVTFSKNSVDHFIKRKKRKESTKCDIRDVAPVARNENQCLEINVISKKSVFDRSCNVAHRRRSTHCRK